MLNGRKSFFSKISLLSILGCAIAYGASDMLYKYSISSVELAAGLVPNKLTLSAYQEVTYRDNENSSPRRDRMDNVGYETGLNGTFVRSKAWATYGVNGDVSYSYWQHESSDDDSFDWNISPKLMLSVQKDNSFIQNLHISLSSNSQFDKLSKTDSEKTRHIDNYIGLAYDMRQNGHFGNVLTFDYTYDYYLKKKYRNRTYQEWEVGTAPYYSFSDRFKIGIHFAYIETTYKEYNDTRYQSDSSEHDIIFFSEYKPTTKFSVYSEAGVTRTRYKGEGRHTEGNNDWEPTGRLRVKYDAGSFWDIAYNFSMSFDDSEVSGKIGGSYKIDNHINVGWKPSKKFDITNTLGVEIEDEKDNCDDDTCEYYYNLVANYHFLPKFTLYANYDFSNVQYKYKGRESYYESEITLGLKYTF